MDYEKLYKESLERAKNIYGASESKDILSTLTTIFPELKESEDERIRKELYDFCIKCGHGDTFINQQADFLRWAAWLEKQGEQKLLVIDEGKAEMDYCFTKMMNGEKVSSAWSEEDKENLNQLHKLIIEKAHRDYEIDTDDETLWGKYAILSNWLKSLKDRVQLQCKPSEEQMKSLSLATQCMYAEEDIKNLNSLYEQLKKL